MIIHQSTRLLKDSIQIKVCLFVFNDNCSKILARSTVHTSVEAQNSTFTLTDRHQPPKRNQHVFINIHEQFILMVKKAFSCNFKKVRKKKKSYTYPSIEICTKSLWGVFGAETTLPLVPPFLCNPADRPANQPYLHHRDNHRKKIDKYYKICTARDWTFCGASSPSTHFLAMPASNAGWLVIWSVCVPYAQTIVHRINPCDFVDL